jgi:predicted acyltransferase (DUF342 family)
MVKFLLVMPHRVLFRVGKERDIHEGIEDVKVEKQGLISKNEIILLQCIIRLSVKF